MANNLTAAATEAVQQYYDRINSASANAWTRFYTVKTDAPTDTTYQPVDLSGVTAFTTQDAAGSQPSATDMFFAGAAYSTVAYEKRITYTLRDARLNPNLLADTATAMADRAVNDIASLAWGTWDTAEATAHPSAGTRYDAGVFIADVFTNPISQQNSLTTVLGDAGLSTAKQYMRGYLNKDGAPVDYMSDPVLLVVPPALETTARNLIGRTAQEYDGTALADATAWGLTDVVVDLYTADTTDWGLVSTARNPFGMWIQQMPFLNVTVAEGAGRIEMYAGFEAGVWLRPFEGGFVKATVAG